MVLEQAIDVCERLRERIAACTCTWTETGGTVTMVTVRIGLSTTPPFDAAALMHSADEALSRAKRSGRNRLCISAG